MDERDLRGLLDQVKAGAMSRRGFVRRMAAVGLAAPFANQLLALSGVAMAQTRPVYKPTKRGGGGLLKVLWWQGRNITRWQNKEYDEIFKAAQGEVDPVKRAAMMIKMNDMVVNEHVVIPVVARPIVTAVSNKLTCELSGWDNNTWDLANWFREA